MKNNHREDDSSDPHSWSPSSQQRVGDVEREEILRYLSVMHQGGYLDYGELLEKIDGTFRARTWGDLAVLVHNLPLSPMKRKRPVFQVGSRITVPILLWSVFMTCASVFGLGTQVPWQAALLAFSCAGAALYSGGAGLWLARSILAWARSQR